MEEKTIKSPEKFNVADFKWQCTCGHVSTIAKGLTEPVEITFNLQSDSSMNITCPQCKKMGRLFMDVNKNIRG